MGISRPVAGLATTTQDHGFHPLRVTRVIRETSEASSFVLEAPEELRTAFAYEAGQFCTFRVPVEGQPLLRCYSMSSSPAVDLEFQVTVKRTPGGVVSNWMNDHLKAGDTIEVTRPAGVFCLTPSEGDVVAFSAGSGITPVHSLMKSALADTSRMVRLFYANRDADAVIFGSEIDALQGQHRQRLTVSHHLDVDGGFVQPDTIRAFARGSGNSEFYICGPGPFMDIVEHTLQAEGVDDARIHIERFTPAERLEEPESSASSATGTRVTIDLFGKSDSAEHRAGTTILQTARQMGMSPPFSCEAGSCATCMARLTAGTADMHVNNALTDDEVADGWVLTCQAVPTSPSVHVVYEEG
jgi:3-ketosteroid 9alpha-monooxygenase subunit B